MNKRIIVTAAVFAIFAVSLGAFGAHGLKGRITSEALELWKTAVEYHFYHTLAMLFLVKRSDGYTKMINMTFYCFVLGIILFSGSLYLLALRQVFNSPLSFLGPVTPLGGLLFIVGWFGLLFSALKRN